MGLGFGLQIEELTFKPLSRLSFVLRMLGQWELRSILECEVFLRITA